VPNTPKITPNPDIRSVYNTIYTLISNSNMTSFKRFVVKYAYIYVHPW